MESACKKANNSGANNCPYQVIRKFAGEKTVEEILAELIKVHTENN